MLAVVRDDGAPMPLTLAYHATRYVEERLSRAEIGHNTARSQRSHLRGLTASFGSRLMSDFDRTAIERWQTTIARLSPASRRLQLSTVRSFCRWLVEHHLLAVDPTVALPRVRQPRSVPRALSKASVAKILIAAPDGRARAILWLMLGCGLRCCEVAALEVADYDPDQRTVTIVGKGGHQRILPVPDDTARAVDQYLTEVGTIYGPLIRSHRRGETGAGLAPGAVSKLVSNWMADAGVKVRNRDGISAHSIRHTAASDVLEACGDVRLVQEMLGHTSLATTTVYLRRAELGRLRAAMGGRDYRT